MPSEVNASKTLDRIRFCIEFDTKYSPTVTPPPKIKLKTRKNFAPNLCTHSGNQRLVGMQASPIIKVCK